MVGFNPNFNPINIYNLVIDNIKMNEVKNNTKDVRKYGVDYLFKS